jgi:hypothetical protein
LQFQEKSEMRNEKGRALPLLVSLLLIFAASVMAEPLRVVASTNDVAAVDQRLPQ